MRFLRVIFSLIARAFRRVQLMKKMTRRNLIMRERTCVNWFNACATKIRLLNFTCCKIHFQEKIFLFLYQSVMAPSNYVARCNKAIVSSPKTWRREGEYVILFSFFLRVVFTPPISFHIEIL